jgi:hypothetical protein
MLKLQAIFHDDSVGLEIMTNDPSEAEEMRQQWLEFDSVAEVLILDERTNRKDVEGLAVFRNLGQLPGAEGLAASAAGRRLGA